MPRKGRGDPAAAMDAELFENALQVGADRGGFDAKPMGDDLVGQSLANHQRHLELALRQPWSADRLRRTERLGAARAYQGSRKGRFDQTQQLEGSGIEVLAVAATPDAQVADVALPRI